MIGRNVESDPSFFSAVTHFYSKVSSLKSAGKHHILILFPNLKSVSRVNQPQPESCISSFWGDFVPQSVRGSVPLSRVKSDELCTKTTTELGSLEYMTQPTVCFHCFGGINRKGTRATELLNAQS